MRGTTRVLWILIGIPAIIAIGIGSFWLTLILFSNNPDVRVPDLHGMEMADAMKVLQEKELVLYLEGYDYSSEAPMGAIFDQNPKPGKFCKEGRKVHIRISKGAARNAMPQLAGMPLHQAAAMVEKLGMTPGDLIHMHDEQMKPGRIAATYPGEGSEIGSGQMVSMVVSEGSFANMYIMPVVIGKHIDSVRRMFSRAGFEIKNLRYKAMGGAANGEIISQLPSPGMPVSSEDDVHLTVQGTAPENDHESYTFKWRMPQDLKPSRVRVVVVHEGAAQNLWDRQMEGGEELVVAVPWVDHSTVTVYLNERLVYEESL